jgi:malonate-semialdehyde dehydrogenase (acetylating)/methylmalonate-semialdehyde dehydrogenase
VKQIDHYIGGRRVAGRSGRTGPVYDPSLGAEAARVAFASAEEVDEVVAVAQAAFDSWRSTPLTKRSEVLFAFRELIRERRSELAAAVTAEHGKVLSDALGEVARGLENVDFACGIPHLLEGGFSEQAATGIDVTSIRQPLGVCVGITPFNFPAMVPLWMLAGAVACGNSFILKPSEKDPSAALLLARWFSEAGLPDGVFNVVQGDREAVDRLLAHADVKAISFVGSTPVARSIYERGTAAGKRVQALGGAKNHMVVLPDADLEMAADAAVSAAFGSAGERCMAISVVVPVGDVAEPLIAAIEQRMADIRIGTGTDPDAEMGPLITREHRDRVAEYLDAAIAEGATLVADGRQADVSREGFFLGVSLVDHVTPDMSVYEDEIFGPVLAVTRADTFDQAVELINDNPWGNGCALFTRDGGAARRFQYEVDCGMVGINVPIPVPVAWHSFGGWKESLFGDAHMYGPEGIRFYTRTKVVTSRWPDPATSRVDLGFPRND